MLEACNNNLEMAVTMFLDGGGIAEEPSTSSASVSTVRPHTEYEFIISLKNIYLFIYFRWRGREGERGRNISMQLPL